MRKILLLSILMLIGMVGYSQKIVSVSNPLEEYFQKNYDSTIFYYSSQSVGPFIYIISKKGDKLYNYKYHNTTFEDVGISYKKDEIGPLDKELRNVFTSRLEKFKKTKPSINQYFIFFNTDSISNIKIMKMSYYGKKGEVDEIYSPLWIILHNFNLWSLKDESNEGLTNSLDSNGVNSKDIFVLISKGQVKKLEYRKLDRPSDEKNELRKKVSEIRDKIWMSLTRIN
jgi:hypothetical protein